ncbi:MAG: flagellar biosynthetic protein FliR [Armatimonadetes bacterium]|nr:flagellar biosynthetic protein FliR [Armatimonadota bacterium]
MNEALFFAFFMVFIRCSALLLSSPMFGAQSTPLFVRIFTTLCIAGALTVAIQPNIGPMPTNFYEFGVRALHEALAGLLIGSFASLALQAAQIAGGMLDLQVGLASSQVLNPLNGVPVTLIAQFKTMLGLMIYISVDGHHALIGSLVMSYQAGPLGYESLPALRDSAVSLIEQSCLIGLQIAAPVIAVSLVVDAGLGLINRAVPQMPVMLVGAPVKIGVGLAMMAIALPAMSGGMNQAMDLATQSIRRVMH